MSVTREKLPVDASNHVQVALLVREKISKKSRWCKGKLARDRDQISVSVTSPKAISFCLIGARAAVLGRSTETDEEANAAYSDADLKGFAEFLGLTINYDRPCTALYKFNDSASSHAEIIQRLDDAIAGKFAK